MREIRTLLELEDLFKTDREYLWQLRDHIGSLGVLHDRAEERAQGCGCGQCHKHAEGIAQRLDDAQFTYDLEKERQSGEGAVDTDEYHLMQYALSKLENDGEG